MSDSASDHGGLSASESALQHMIENHIAEGGWVVVGFDGDITLGWYENAPRGAKPEGA